MSKIINNYMIEVKIEFLISKIQKDLTKLFFVMEEKPLSRLSGISPKGVFPRHVVPLCRFAASPLKGEKNLWILLNFNRIVRFFPPGREYKGG
jgi:hypothetical protein